jgi:hypothetical protein
VGLAVAWCAAALADVFAWSLAWAAALAAATVSVAAVESAGADWSTGAAADFAFGARGFGELGIAGLEAGAEAAACSKGAGFSAATGGAAPAAFFNVIFLAIPFGAATVDLESEGALSAAVSAGLLAGLSLGNTIFRRDALLAPSELTGASASTGVSCFEFNLTTFFIGFAGTLAPAMPSAPVVSGATAGTFRFLFACSSEVAFAASAVETAGLPVKVMRGFFGSAASA